MINLSNDAKRLTSTFLQYRNDVDIYTEDNEKDKEFYRILFKRLLRDDLTINDVTPLGSKSEVIKRCENEPENGRKKIFIIDGDIAIIHGTKIPNLHNLFVLNAYCVENLLLDKLTIIQFIYMSCGVKSMEKVEEEVDFDNWLAIYTDALINLFIHYAIIDFFGGKFTLFNAHKFHKYEKGHIIFKPHLVELDILNLKEEILLLTTEVSYKKKYLELKQRWSANADNLLTIVSGKDYLIPILLFKNSSIKASKVTPSLEEAKFSLAFSGTLDRFTDLKDAIKNL